MDPAFPGDNTRPSMTEPGHDRQLFGAVCHQGTRCESGYDRRQTSIQRLTAEYLGGQTPAALGPDELTVAIDVDVMGGVAVRPMPAIGQAYDE